MMRSGISLEELRQLVIDENDQELLNLYDEMLNSKNKITIYEKEAKENNLHTYTYEEAYEETLNYLTYKYGSIEELIDYEMYKWDILKEEVGDEDLVSKKTFAYNIIYNPKLEINTYKEAEIESRMTILGYNLNAQEAAYCGSHVSTCNKAYEFAQGATSQAEARYHYGGTQDDFVGNAFKHSFWNAQMSYSTSVGNTAAAEIGCRHEELTASTCDYAHLEDVAPNQNIYLRSKMDLNNNAYGRMDGVTYKGSEHDYYFNKYGSLASWQEARVTNG